MTYTDTPYCTNRLVLKRSELPRSNEYYKKLIIVLGILSAWGGADKVNEEVLSWEFDSEITESIIKKILLKLHCEIDNENVDD